MLPHIRHRPDHAMVTLRPRPQVRDVGSVVRRVVFQDVEGEFFDFLAW